MKWVSKKELKNKNEELNKEIRRISGLNNRLLTEKNKQEKQLKTIKETQKISDTLIDALNINIENIKKKLDNTEKSRRKNAGKIGGMQKEINVLKTELNEAQNIIKNLNKENISLKARNKKTVKAYCETKTERV